MKRIKNDILLLFTFLFLIGQIFFISTWTRAKVSTYELLQGTVLSMDTLEFVVSDKQLTLLQSNSFFYSKEKKYTYKIDTVYRNVLKRKKKSYHDVIIKTKLEKEYKENDSFEVFFALKKISFFQVFRSVWKGEK